MLKFLFLILLLANGLMFAYHQGQLASLLPNGREPERMKQQLNADKIKLVDPPAASADQVVPVAATAPKPACMELGHFSTAQARQLEPQLAGLGSGGKLSRHEIIETSSHMVLIPSQGSREGAEKKAAELRNRGVTEFFVIQDVPDNRWGLSLGVFKSEEAARAHLAALQQKGVRSARVVDHKVQFNRVAFQLRGFDANAMTALDKIRSELPRHELRTCE